MYILCMYELCVCLCTYVRAQTVFMTYIFSITVCGVNMHVR